MNFFRLGFILVLIVLLTACGQTETKENDDGNANGGGGIAAGKLQATVKVEGNGAVFQIKNQTEVVKELIIPGKIKYEYIIMNEEGERVFQNAKSKPQYEQKHPITLKQAEETEFKLILPEKLTPGKYTITAILHTKPAIKASTAFTVEK